MLIASVYASGCSSPRPPRGRDVLGPTHDAALPALASIAPADAGPPPELDCPADAVVTYAPAPARIVACARADGTLDGPYLERHPDGTIAVQGRHADGRRAGAWVQRAPDGRELARTEFTDGTGTEIVLGDAATPIIEVGWQAGVRHGPTRWWNRDGALVLDETWQAGALDGPRTVGVEATMRITEQRAAGLRVGKRLVTWRGQRRLVERYDDDGRLDGAWIAYRDGGKRKREAGSYAHGLRTGTWTWWGRAQDKEREGGYVDGARHGVWRAWSDGVEIVRGTWHGGLADGTFIERTAAGAEVGRYTMTRGTGTVREWYADGKRARAEAWLDGARHGPITAWHRGGEVAVSGSHDAGARHGSWQEHAADGTLRLEASYEHGAQTGAWRRFRADGSLETEASYAAGRRDGAYVERRADGSAIVAGSFVADRKHGVWTETAADGAEITRASWRDGVLDGPWRARARDGTVVTGQHADGRRSGTWAWTGADGAVVRTETY